MIYKLEDTQIVPASIAKTWEFFSQPLNLREITPPGFGFEVQGNPGKKIYQGQLIEYRVRPLFGIPMRWLTEITHVREQEYFCDEQRVGPYRIWHHEHFFEKAAGGTLMRDLVTYVLPFGLPGRIALPLVRARLRAVFDYRREAVLRIFGPAS
jgi:ligand-binding SRPBCC domain-containing protein